MRHYILVVVFVVILGFFVMGATTYNPDVVDIGGAGLQDGGGVSTPTTKSYPDDCDGHLTLSASIMCTNVKRNPVTYGVFGVEDYWYHGSAGPYPGNNIGLTFLNDGSPWSGEPVLNVDMSSMLGSDIMFYRYEGKTWGVSEESGYTTDCRMVVTSKHKKKPSALVAGNTEADDDNPNAYYEYQISGSRIYDVVPENIFSYAVDWDNDPTSCRLIGGAWLGDTAGIVSSPESFSHSSVGSWRCCGDDWIWLYNKPINYQKPTAGGANLQVVSEDDPLCLYTRLGENPYGYATPVDPANGYESGYRCTPSDHSQYDPILQRDNLIESETIGATIDSNNYFRDIGAFETDLGKWSNAAGTEIAYCDHYFDNTNGKGEQFRWMTIADAAQKDQLTCDLFLGYGWTGTQCCGLDTSTFSDPEPECNAKARANELSNQYKLSSPEFENEFNEVCSQLKYNNSACFEGRLIGNKKSMGTRAVPDNKVAYNKNGTISFCDYTLAGFDTKSKCDIMGDGLYDFAVCTYGDSWVDYADSRNIGFDTANTEITTYDLLADSVHTSSVPSGVTSLGDTTEHTECCVMNSCWNGSSCVSEWSTYRNDNGDWREFSFESDPYEKDGQQIYKCANGTWRETYTKFNWYKNKEEPNFCVDKHSCYCTATDCSSDNVFGDCTKTQNYFNNDHYCEAEYDSSGSLAGAEWTSRTKLLAFQLLDIAGSTTEDYTIFCDQYRNSVNYYEPLVATNTPVNSFCVLDMDDQRIIGTTLNVEPDQLNNLLFNSQYGFVKELLEEDLNACDVVADGPHGSFKKCYTDNNRVWYNSKTMTLIYSKEGMAGNELSVSDPNSYNVFFADRVTDFDNFIAQKGITSPTGIGNIKLASDFDRLYISKKSDSEIFGVVETIHNSEYSALKRILAVSYSNMNINCEEIKNSVGANSIICDQNSGKTYIIWQSSTGNFAYWNDLTAKLRL